jgi:hypothetical protein
MSYLAHLVLVLLGGWFVASGIAFAVTERTATV